MRWLGMLGVMTGLGAATAAWAAEPEPICADRPGKSSETCTVPAGRVQVEVGLADWSLQKSGGARDTELTVGETSIKYGLTDRSDVEIELTPYVRVSSRAGGVHERASGFGDTRILYKHVLTRSGAALEVSAYPFVKLPTAGRALGNGKLEAGLLIPVAYAIAGSPFSIGTTPELDWVADADGRGPHFATAQVVSLGWQATERLNLSADIWGQWDWDPAGTQRQVSADASAAYLVNRDLQLDAGANLGLNRQTPDVELYAGVSVRF
jgi:hypothetical protein